MVIRKLGLVVMVTTKGRNERAYRQAQDDLNQTVGLIYDTAQDAYRARLDAQTRNA